MRDRNCSQRKLRMERLEDRSMMAGVVNVKIVDSTDGLDVVITGDGNANYIEITQPSLDTFQITGKTYGGSATRITGLRTFDLFDFEDDIRIDMGGGSDKLIIRGNNSDIGDLDAHNDLIIKMGTGDDSLSLTYFDANTGDVNVDLGTGTDTFTASHVNVDDDFIVKNSTTNRTRRVVKVTLDDIFAPDEIKIDLRFSLDRVNITNSDADYWFVDLWSGDDKLNIKFSDMDVSSDLDGGDGNDDLNFYQNETSYSHSNFKNPTNKNIFYT